MAQKKAPKKKQHSDVWIELMKASEEFIVVEKETEANPDEGRLRCPKKFCKGEFVVDRKKFKETKVNFVKRSCPYCFTTSFVPGTKDRILAEEGID